MDKIVLPTRDVVAKVSHDNQRMIRWFEGATVAVNEYISGGGTGGGGSGGILDMGDRMTGTSLYDGGSRV